MHLAKMMLCRQRTLFFATLVVCAFFAQESSVMVSAQDAKEDKEDKEDNEVTVEDPVEIDVADASAAPTDSPFTMDTEIELPMADDNSTMIEDMDCTCDENIITCSDPSDEEACVCEDGDVVCEDAPVETVVEIPVSAPVDEPPAPDTAPAPDMAPADSDKNDSGASSSSSMISMAISAVGIAAVALN